MIVEFLPDPTSNNINHVNSQRTQQPIQYTHRYMLNLQKRADSGPIGQQRDPQPVARGRLPK